MSTRAKLAITIAVVWLAVVGGIVAYYVANPTTVRLADSECDESDLQATLDCLYVEQVNTGAMWVAIGVATVVAIAVMVITLAWTSRPKGLS